jgi:hypothetical protein
MFANDGDGASDGAYWPPEIAAQADLLFKEAKRRGTLFLVRSLLGRGRCGCGWLPCRSERRDVCAFAIVVAAATPLPVPLAQRELPSLGG